MKNRKKNKNQVDIAKLINRAMPFDSRTESSLKEVMDQDIQLNDEDRDEEENQ